MATGDVNRQLCSAAEAIVIELASQRSRPIVQLRRQLEQNHCVIPVLGRGEDAVDRLATLLMTPIPGEQEPEYLTRTISGWFASAADKPLDQITWWGQHGADQQRG